METFLKKWTLLLAFWAGSESFQNWWAASVVGLFLVSLVSFAGIAGGYFFNVVIQKVTPGAYFQGFTSLVQLPDLYSSLAKAFVFGFIAAMVSCYKGIYAKGGPKANV